MGGRGATPARACWSCGAGDLAPSPRVWRSLAGPSGPALKGARNGASSSPSRVRCLRDEEVARDDLLKIIYMQREITITLVTVVSRRSERRSEAKSNHMQFTTRIRVVSATKQKSEQSPSQPNKFTTPQISFAIRFDHATIVFTRDAAHFHTQITRDAA